MERNTDTQMLYQLAWRELTEVVSPRSMESLVQFHTTGHVSAAGLGPAAARRAALGEGGALDAVHLKRIGDSLARG